MASAAGGAVTLHIHIYVADPKTEMGNEKGMSLCDTPNYIVLWNGFILWLLFAGVYAAMHALDPRHFQFTNALVDPLYFSATTTSTVGYGDLSPKTRLARLVVIVHMMGTIGFFIALARSLKGARD